MVDTCINCTAYKVDNFFTEVKKINGKIVCCNKIYNGKYYINRILINPKYVLCSLVPAKDTRINHLEGNITIDSTYEVLIIPKGELKDFLIEEDCIGKYFNVVLDEGNESCCALGSNFNLYVEESVFSKLSSTY